MKTNTFTIIRRAAGVALAAGLAFGAFVAPASAQQAFPSAQAAADALVDGIARHDYDQVKAILGSDYGKFIPQRDRGAEDKTRFLEAWARSHKIVASGADRAMLEVGTNGWTLPIPLVKGSAGWSFDVKAAPEEMRKRRIGRNELAAIQVALAYADAQDEYFKRNPDGAPVKHYAMKGLSSPGKRDGLYWATLDDEEESPLGAEFADAKPGEAYHGYLYKILTAQGKNAPGGAKSYVKDGRMVDGYALVAYPERWGDTGVMSFIVSRDGIVYQKNLGPNTASAVKAINAYDPDPSWEKAAAR